MFEEIRKEIKDTPEFQEDLKTLIEKRLYEGLPNSFLVIMEILKDDPTATKLLEAIRDHVEERTAHGKVALEKQQSNEDSLIMHMFDDQGVTSSATTISPLSGDVATDYQIESETFDALKEHAIDFSIERTVLQQELPTRIV